MVLQDVYDEESCGCAHMQRMWDSQASRQQPGALPRAPCSMHRRQRRVVFVGRSYRTQGQNLKSP